MLQYRGHLYRVAGRLDVQTIEGFRRWWKQWANKKVVVAQVGFDGIMRHLREGQERLQQLATDLMLTRGLVQTEARDPKDRRDKNVTWYFTHVAELLQQANGMLYAAEVYVRDSQATITPGTHDYEMSNWKDRQQYWLDLPGNAGKTMQEIAFGWCQDRADGAVAKADSIVSRQLFRHLKSLVNKFGDDQGAGKAIDIMEYNLEYNIGNVKVVSYVAKEAVDVSRSLDAPADYVYQHVYVQSISRAEEILRQKGLGSLWYGIINVKPLSWATGIPYAGREGHKAAATYDWRVDEINLYLPKTATPLMTFVLHEMGHRYYYKFMTRADRNDFDQWFNEVQPVSDYGGVDTAEDFAEVFMHYCLNRDLTRDQLERFKRFLGRRRAAMVVAEEITP